MVDTHINEMQCSTSDKLPVQGVNQTQQRSIVNVIGTRMVAYWHMKYERVIKNVTNCQPWQNHTKQAASKNAGTQQMQSHHQPVSDDYLLRKLLIHNSIKTHYVVGLSVNLMNEDLTG